jgi:hypothetical protein
VSSKISTAMMGNKEEYHGGTMIIARRENLICFINKMIIPTKQTTNHTSTSD